MFSYLYQWIMNISFYMIMVTAVMHIVPNAEYKRYIRFFTGLVLAVMLTDPFLKLLGIGDLWQNLYESPAYREQVEKMEEAAQYLDGVMDAGDIKENGQMRGTGPEEETETQRNPEEETDDGTRISVEKIEIER